MVVYDKCPFCEKRLPVRVVSMEGDASVCKVTLSVYCRRCKRDVRIVKELRSEPLE